jgi:hypothetical protein
MLLEGFVRARLTGLPAMPALAVGVVGMIEMERTPSRVEAFFPEEGELDTVGELTRLANAGPDAGLPYDGSADETLSADVERLAEELEAQYAALCAALEAAR